MIAELREAIGDGENRHLIVDNVISSPLLKLLRDVSKSDGEFEEVLKLRSAAKESGAAPSSAPRGTVSAQRFAHAEDNDKFINQRRLTGPKPGKEGSPAMNADTLLRRAFQSEGFLSWLTQITGITISRAGGINLKLHGPGSFLRRHSDERAGRKVCLVLYIHEDWQDEYAGRFLLHLADGTTKAIDPIPNRLILFDVRQKNAHEVEGLGDVPSGWVRINYSAWFG